MSLRRRLLAELNRPWRRDPLPVDALTLTYDGPGAVAITITEGQFLAVGRDGAVSVTLDLNAGGLPPAAGLTLAALVDGLAHTIGYTASVLPAYAAVLAVTLVDESSRPLHATPTVFAIWTSPTWRVLEPVRQALRQTGERIDLALTQMNLLRAATYFADLWGRYTTTTRRPLESDALYTARQLHELIRPREGNALARTIEEDTGVPIAEVNDLRRQVLLVSGSPLLGRPLAGSRYNTATVEVVLDGLPTLAVIQSAFTHAAAGVHVLVRGVMRLVHGTSDVIVTSGQQRHIQIGAILPMQIGVGTISLAKIG